MLRHKFYETNLCRSIIQQIIFKFSLFRGTLLDLNKNEAKMNTLNLNHHVVMTFVKYASL